VDAQTVVLPGDEQFGLASETFKLLADSTRLKILWALLQREHSVGDLARQVGAQPAAVSQHLAKLRAAYLVRVRREGNRMYYDADDAHVRHLVEQALRRTAHLVADRPGGGDQPGERPVRTVA
jgi:DNA-binding transcriptional ArsR family regulator